MSGKNKSAETKKKDVYQSRNWCFTDYNEKYLENKCDINRDLTFYYNLFHNNAGIIRYIRVQIEHGEKTGREHLQGWVQFETKRTRGGAQRILKSKTLHMEACRGDEHENEIYTTKPCLWCNGKKHKKICLGKFVCQGQRTDLEQVKYNIQQGKSIKQIADDNFETFCRYRGGINQYKQLCDQEATIKFRNVEVNVLFGKTGTGKTKYAFDHGATYKIDADEIHWWDGYNGDDCILIDDFNNQVPITRLLTLLHGHQERLPIKGGFTWAKFTKVFITTNLEWKDWYPNCQHSEHLRALLRRITNFAEVLGTGNTVAVPREDLVNRINDDERINTLNTMMFNL